MGQGARNVRPTRKRCVVVAAAAATLLAGVLQSTGVEAQPNVEQRPEVQEGRPGDVSALPLLGEEDGRAMTPPQRLPLDTAMGDFTRRPGDSPSAPSGFDAVRSVEVPERTTETTKIFRNPDGTETAQISSKPARVRDETGAWREIDPTLVESGGRLRPKASASGVEIPTNPAEGLVSVPAGTGRISVSLPDAVVANGSARRDQHKAVVDGATAIDSKVAVTATGFEQSVIIPDASGPASYRLTFTLPAGVTAREGGPGVEFLVGGEPHATFGAGAAFDAAAAGGPADPTATPVHTRLVSTSAGTATAEVSIDPQWLRDPARVFPVTIDPTYSKYGANADTTVRKTYGSQWGLSWLQSGTFDNGATTARSLLKFDLPPTGPNYGVTESHLSIFTEWGWTCTPRPMQVVGLADSFGSSTTWENQPPVDSSGVVSTTWFNKGNGGACPADTQTVDVTALAQRWMDGTAPNHGMQLRAEDETSDNWSWKKFSATEHPLNGPWLFITYQTVPSAPTLVAPTDGANLLTTTPTLSVGAVTDPDTSGAVRYWYRVWTSSAMADKGQQIDSGWVSSTSWTVPAGALADGGTFKWKVYADDGSGAHVSVNTSRTFTVNTRSGQGASDQVGPVGVDLGTGNATVSVPGAAMGTAGGGIGVGFTYNSQDLPATGLTASYYNDANNNKVGDAGELVITRRDPLVAFNWEDGSPYDGVDEDRFVARWTGTITVPSTGTMWNFGATHDDRVRITVNGNVVLDKWTDGAIATTTPDWSPNYSTLTGGVPVPIIVDYYEGTGVSQVSLWAWDHTGGSYSAQIVPSTWLAPWETTTTTEPRDVLPSGWTMSLPGSVPLAVTAAYVFNDFVVFRTSTAYGFLAYMRSGDDWVSFFPDDPNVLVVAPDKSLTLETPSAVFKFRSDGLVESMTTKLDSSVSSGSPTYTYTNVTIGSGTQPRLTTVTDPTSGRSITLTYKSGSNCPTVYDAPPAGMLCRVDYWDGTGTDIFYSAGQIARVQNPGAALYDFWYGTNGKLTDIRDPLAADAVNAGIRGGGWPVRTLISYDTSTPARVTQVRAPEPTAGAARPGHTYVYNTTSSDVRLNGLTTAVGYFRKVEFDGDGRLLRERDGKGRATETTWDTVKERVKWVDTPPDAAGVRQRTTNIYDVYGRVTDSYGPARHDWFDGTTGLPLSQYTSQVPRNQTRFDEGMNSLAATWFESGDLAGVPKAFGTGIGGTNGNIDKDWGAGAPPEITPTDNWSVRLTGFVNFNAGGTVPFRLQRDGKARIWLHERLMASDWTESTAPLQFTESAIQPGYSFPITIEYADTAGNARLALEWSLDGGQTFVPVPGAQLNPNYGLATSTVDADSKSASAAYPSPHLRQPTSASQDPAGLNLTSTATYETSGLRRRLTRSLPAGNQWTYAYYGNAELRDNPCPGGATGINQGGALKTRTGPAPGAGSAVVNESVYDKAGRPVATRYNTEATWTCISYDARGRPTQRTVPAFGNESARTLTYDYDVNANPLVQSIFEAETNLTVTTEIDLLARPIKTTDVWNKTTNITYSQAGFKTQTTGGPQGNEDWAFNDAGQLTSYKLDGLVVATISYDDAFTGRVLRYDYPTGTGNGGNGTKSNGITASGTLQADFVYDDLGRQTGLAWKEPGGALITSDHITSRSLAGRITDRKVDGVDPYTGGNNYTYDGAGRLTQAWVNGSTNAYNYDFAQWHAGCGSVYAGKNTNRTSMSVGTDTTTYCYDDADRLTSFSKNQGPSTTLTYDAHGNATGYANETHRYDGDNRHLATLTSQTERVRYKRDPMNNIVERTDNGTIAARYSGAAILDTNNNVIERTVSLPGGAILTKRTGGDVWSYPNTQGTVVAVANASGVKQGATMHYDPYGVALGGIPDNAPGTFDFGWIGVQPTEHASGLTGDRVEMGARQYMPSVGRFLGVDPVEGGSANDYDYTASDPVNRSDTSGLYPGDNAGTMERLYCLGFNFSKCLVANNLANRALEFARELFPTHQGRQNAFRHAYWMMSIVSETGDHEFARGLGRAHEFDNLSNGGPVRESLIDLHNNEMGIRIGRAIIEANISRWVAVAFLYVFTNADSGVITTGT